MSVGLFIDIFVVLIIVAAVVSGFARGFLRTLGTVAGIVAGGAAALIVMPIISAQVPFAGWNVTAAILAGLALVAIGIAIGEAIAHAIRKPVHRVGLGFVDRFLGGVAGLVASTAVLLILAMSAGSFGVPGIAQAVASSKVLSFLEETTPPPVQSALAQLRSITIDDGLPVVLDAAGIADADAEVPDADANTTALQTAAASVTRITTNAPTCSAASSGSGFVIGEGLVMTNAHVVAGAQDVVVEASGEFPRSATVVYFDPDADIAVLSVSGLTAAPLPFSASPAVGETVFFQGFPYGGPFTSRSAKVLSTAQLSTPDIYQAALVSRSVTSIAGVVQPGNSGGPLLTADGALAGMIFARSESPPNVGFALSMEELAPVLAAAPGLTAAVPTGACA
ncbi:MAG: MarP family serine protease [Leucobacter sp.]